MAQQKYALITGASSGIGYQLAIAFSKKGYKVFGCAPESVLFEMKPLTEEYGVVAFGCDITNIDDVKKAAKLVGEQTGGRLDILYNNAGISFGGPAVEMPDDELVKIFNVNTIGHITMTKYMVDYVIAAKGTIVSPVPWPQEFHFHGLVLIVLQKRPSTCMLWYCTVK